jgi:hypothetical protein
MWGGICADIWEEKIIDFLFHIHNYMSAICVTVVASRITASRNIQLVNDLLAGGGNVFKQSGDDFGSMDFVRRMARNQV